MSIKIREHKSGGEVEVKRIYIDRIKEFRTCLIVTAGDGVSAVQIDLGDVLKWVKENRWELME